MGVRAANDRVWRRKTNEVIGFTDNLAMVDTTSEVSQLLNKDEISLRMAGWLNWWVRFMQL